MTARLLIAGVGNIFFGESGFLTVDHSGIEVYKSTAGNISGDAARGAGAGSKDRYEKIMSERADTDDTVPHMQNFFAAIRKRDFNLLHADIEIGARSAAFCHLANTSYRLGRMLKVSQSRVFALPAPLTPACWLTTRSRSQAWIPGSPLTSGSICP